MGRRVQRSALQDVAPQLQADPEVVEHAPRQARAGERRLGGVQPAIPGVVCGTIRGMATLDLLVRGATLIDGTGRPGRLADVGVRGDRIAAVGDLSAVDPAEVAVALEGAGRVVCPGFVDPHGHSDASVFLDPALASHLHQGFTTQLSGNCGDSVAPVTPAGRENVELSLASTGLAARWTTFAGYLDEVERLPLGPNVAFLAGHGTLRASVLGNAGREPAPAEMDEIVGHLEEALEAGALGLSSGLIYAPGMHAPAWELERLVAVTARRGGLYATHMRNEAGGLFAALEEALRTARAAGDGARLQVSHLKAGAKASWGRAGEAIALLERARAGGLDVAADQYPYTAAATSLQTILPPALLALPIDQALSGLDDWDIRQRVKLEIARGVSGWEDVAGDPGWGGIIVSESKSHPGWAGRSFAALARELERDPVDVALDVLRDDRLDSWIVVDCMSEPDVETILRVPWVAVCTDAEGRRPDNPVLGAGVPHPRTYGTAPRVLGRYVRERGVLPLETAIAKLTSVAAARLGLRDRGVVREGAFADLVVLDPATVADTATYQAPHAFPVGIDAVIVNGAIAVRDGVETGAGSGRLLRRG